MLIDRMNDLADYAARAGMAHSKFLTPAEQIEIQQRFLRRSDIELVFEGGTADAERRAAVFLARDWGSYDANKIMCGLRIDYRAQSHIGHRDILGALMSKGVERNVIGDIIAGESTAYIVCLSEISDYFLNNLDKIGQIGVKISAAPLEQIPCREERLEYRNITVASPRLDALISQAFRVSRSEAAALIKAGLAFVNYTPCDNADRKVEEGDLLSVRGKGKIKIVSLGGQSRKGRLFIQIGIFV